MRIPTFFTHCCAALCCALAGQALALEKPGSPRAQKQALEAAEAWRPLRSYAVMLLWSSLANKERI